MSWIECMCGSNNNDILCKIEDIIYFIECFSILKMWKILRDTRKSKVWKIFWDGGSIILPYSSCTKLCNIRRVVRQIQIKYIVPPFHSKFSVFHFLYVPLHISFIFNFCSLFSSHYLYYINYFITCLNLYAQKQQKTYIETKYNQFELFKVLINGVKTRIEQSQSLPKSLDQWEDLYNSVNVWKQTLALSYIGNNDISIKHY